MHVNADELTLLQYLRLDLQAARYTTAELTALWGSAAEGARQRGVLRPAQRELARQLPSNPRDLGAQHHARAILANVLLLGGSATSVELDLALPRLGADGAETLELVTNTGNGSYRAALSLNPVVLPDPASPISGETIEWWILSDLDDHLRAGSARPDHVMGVGGATRSLIMQGVVAESDTRDSRIALDLGTGCGIVAIALVRAGVGRVIATDISRRALRIAQANVVLNAISERIEFRAGNLFEPVAGESFDLIVSNPPFVITPRNEVEGEASRFEYRDGGMVGDELAARVVREAPSYLTAHGEFVCLANWESPWGARGLDRVRTWIEDAASLAQASLDAWVIERDEVDPTQYAETWARDGGARPGDPEHVALLDAWLDDFAARQIVAVGLGSIRVRKTDASRSTTRTEQAMGMFAAAGVGSALRAAFAAGATADRMSDDDVLATRWIRSDRVSEERDHSPGEEAPRALRLVIDTPIGRRIDVDPMLAAAVGASDGELTLAQLADALATLLEIDAGDTARELIHGMRELAWLGMVTPETQGSATQASLE